MKHSSTPHRIFKFRNFSLDTKQKILLYENEHVPLGEKTYECLLLLVENAGQVVLKKDFFDKIWQDSFVEDGVLAVNIRFLRKVFNDDKDNAKFIVTLPRRGYRFIAKVEVEMTEVVEEFPPYIMVDDSELNLETVKSNIKLVTSPPIKIETEKDFVEEESVTKESDETTTEEPKPASFFNSAKIKYIELVVFFIVGITACLFLYQRYTSIPAPKTPRKVSVAIFPFENISGNQDLNYLSLSLTDSLNYSLSPISQARNIPTSAIKRFVNTDYDPVIEGINLGVENIVTGSFYTEKDKIVVKIQVTNVSGDSPIVQNQMFDAQISDLASLRSSVNKFIVSTLNLNRTPEELLEIQQRETQNPQAYEYYLRGANAYYNTEFDLAINYYEKAVTLDPHFLPALEGLATNYLQKGSIAGCGAPCYKKSIEYFEKVVELAPRYERVQLNLAISYVDSNQIEKAIPLIKSVLNKNPENKHAYFTLSYAYRYAGMLEESAKFVERSKTIDNKDTSFADIPIVYLYRQEYEKFLAELNIPSNNSYGLFYKGLANYYLKNVETAKKMFDDSYRMSPNSLTEKIAKVYSLHLEKKDEEAFQKLNQIKDSIIKNQVNDGEMIYKIAQSYSVINKPKEALEIFNLSVDKGFFCYPYFKNDPLMENARKQPLFEKILHKAQVRHEEFVQKFGDDTVELLEPKKQVPLFVQSQSSLGKS